MPGELNISKETLESFVEDLGTGSAGIEQQYLTGCTDYDTTIPFNANLHDAFNKRNAVIYNLLNCVETEKTNITSIKNAMFEADSTMANAYETEGN